MGTKYYVIFSIFFTNSLYSWYIFYFQLFNLMVDGYYIIMSHYIVSLTNTKKDSQEVDNE